MAKETELTLYWLSDRDRSNRVRWLLLELGVNFEEVQLHAADAEHRQAEYLRTNPFGKVPAIRSGDLTLSESGAIMLYLLERYDREHRFAPAPNTALRPAFLQWLFWGLTSFEGAVMGYTNNLEDPEAQSNLERYLGPLQARFEDSVHIVDDDFTAADIVCAYDLGLLLGRYQLDQYPNVARYLATVLERPAAAFYRRVIGCD